MPVHQTNIQEKKHMKKNNILKKLAVVCLCAAMLLSVTACGGSTPNPSGSGDDEAVALNLLEVNNNYFRNFTQAVRNSAPDMPLNIEYYSGSNPSGYITQKLMSSEPPDIIYFTNQLSDEFQQKYLMDLSGYDFLENYNLSLVNQRDVDGAVYSVPANYSIICMLYNKTLFEEHGWKVPTTHSELVSLCRQIREEEPELIPITHAGSMAGTYWRIMGETAQCGFLGSQDGMLWQEKFVAGEASFEEGFGDTIDKLQELIDAGAFDIADKEAKNNDVTDNLLNRKAAMSFAIGGFPYLVDNLKDCQDEIGGIPYLGDTPEQQFLNVSVTSIGISKKLSEPGNEKKLEAALKVMEYLSTEEGQNAMHVAVTDVSPLAGSIPSEEFPPYKDIWDVFSSGSAAPYILDGYEDIWVEAGTFFRNELFTSGSLDGLSEKMDELHKLALSEGNAPVHVATVPEDLTHPQTVQLMADLLLGAGGDVALVSDGGAINGVPNTNGVSGRLFAGELDHDSYSICIPGNSGKTLVKLTLTGDELFRLIENGRTMTFEDKSAVFDYYWSGMDAVMENGKITSATLADGRTVEPDGKYQVIISAVDYDAEAYAGGEDTGSVIKEAYLEFMTGKTLTAPKTLCR